jgi:segregation and condensation protein B
MDDAQLKNLVEALVFTADKPVTIQRLRQLSRVSDTKRLETALEQLAVDYAPRGIALQQVSGGYQFRTNTQYSVWVQQLIAGRPVRLSRAQLETLAIVAYRQPITRPEVDDIRGVDSSATLRLLLDRSLIRVLGKKEDVGRPTLYGTTKEFLDFFSLSDLRELPTLREYSELTAESRKVMSDRLGIDADAIPTAPSEVDELEVDDETPPVDQAADDAAAVAAVAAVTDVYGLTGDETVDAFANTAADELAATATNTDNAPAADDSTAANDLVAADDADDMVAADRAATDVLVGADSLSIDDMVVAGDASATQDMPAADHVSTDDMTAGDSVSRDELTAADHVSTEDLTAADTVSNADMVAATTSDAANDMAAATDESTSDRAVAADDTASPDTTHEMVAADHSDADRVAAADRATTTDDIVAASETVASDHEMVAASDDERAASDDERPASIDEMLAASDSDDLSSSGPAGMPRGAAQRDIIGRSTDRDEDPVLRAEAEAELDAAAARAHGRDEATGDAGGADSEALAGDEPSTDDLDAAGEGGSDESGT